jgi:hypothetical protein
VSQNLDKDQEINWDCLANELEKLENMIENTKNNWFKELN